MNDVLEVISSIAFVVFVQAAVLIPLTIFAFLVRQWIICGIRNLRYGQKQKLYEKYGMDLIQIPESLHNLIPYAKQFGIVDPQFRKKYQEGISLEEKQAFIRAVRGKEDEILRWLRVIYPHYSKEALAFSFMMKSMSEMNLIIVYRANQGTEIEVYTNAALYFPTKPIPYYYPRPKNRIERFAYDLSSAVIATIIFPVFYYLIVKTWSVFSPNEESVVAFGIICTLASLFSIFTFKCASWVIKRYWKQFANR